MLKGFGPSRVKGRRSCLSKSQEDDIMMMCLSKSPFPKSSFGMGIYDSQDDDSMTMFLSNSQDDDGMMIAY